MLPDKEKNDEDFLEDIPTFDEDVEEIQNEAPKNPQQLSDEIPEDAEIIVEIEDPDVENQQKESNSRDDEGEKKKTGRRAEKRIRQLVSQNHELQKALEEARREAEQYRRVGNTNQEAALQSAEVAIAAEEASLKREWIEADELGDSQKKFEVSQKLTDLTSKKNMLAAYKRRTAAPPPEQPPQRPPVRRAEDMSSEEIDQLIYTMSDQNPGIGKWLDKNRNWFFKETDMREGAMKISDRMIQKEGYDPTSEEYLTELDRRLAAAFPNSFRKPAQKQRQVPVRTPGGSHPPGTAGARPVIRGKLTPDEVRMAKEFGLTPEQWLAEKLRMQSESQ